MKNFKSARHLKIDRHSVNQHIYVYKYEYTYMYEYIYIYRNIAQSPCSQGHQQRFWKKKTYLQTSNGSRTLVGNTIVDHSDVVGASPVGTAPTTPSFSTQHLAPMGWAKTTARREEKHIYVWGFGAPYIRGLTVTNFVIGMNVWRQSTNRVTENKSFCNANFVVTVNDNPIKS